MDEGRLMSDISKLHSRLGFSCEGVRLRIACSPDVYGVLSSSPASFPKSKHMEDRRAGDSPNPRCE